MAQLKAQLAKLCIKWKLRDIYLGEDKLCADSESKSYDILNSRWSCAACSFLDTSSQVLDEGLLNFIYPAFEAALDEIGQFLVICHSTNPYAKYSRYLSFSCLIQIIKI